jgi:2-polyprenyl-3-methyl-5-hydroxy-6-metoxy-1,4-benzoquinol methylase
MEPPGFPGRFSLTEVLELDLTRVNEVQKELTGPQFDWLVAADLLEHLVDPPGMLRFYRDYLRLDGRLVVSLPNVAAWDNRLRLLAGRFKYTDSGLVHKPRLLRSFGHT